MDKIEAGKKLVGIVMSGNTIVDNSVFSALGIVEKGEATAALMKAGGTIEFRESFANLTNHKNILDRLRKGEDVSLELEFNGVTLPANFLAAKNEYFACLTPIEEALAKLVPPYPYAVRPADAETLMKFGTKSVARKNYKLSIAQCKSIWDKASKYWSGNSGKPSDYYVTSGDAGGRYVSFSLAVIEIGCQTIYRWEVEEMATHYGWDFPEAKVKAA